MTNSLAPVAESGDSDPVFSYQAIPGTHREWFRSAASQVRSLAYRTSCDMIRVGQLLASARGRVKRRTFAAWIAAELPWSRSHAYRLIAVGEVFGPLVDPRSEERIEPTALYLLARPEVPPEARLYAVELAGDRHVTAADARDILAAHRAIPDLGKQEVKAHEGRMKPIRDGERKADKDAAKGSPVSHERIVAAWHQFAELAATATVVHVSAIREEGDEDEPLYSVTVYREDDRPRNHVRRSLDDAIGAAIGREEEKVCVKCKDAKPVSMFSDNKDLPGGRNRYCKACERKRLKAFKTKKRAQKPKPDA